ncbi:hypothetical protein MMC17_006310 [Xylographa soralifera]|nr:hypothetical protein [Xylographa soralifera]
MSNPNSLSTILGLVFLSIVTVQVAAVVNATAVCQQLRSLLGNMTILPSDSDYVTLSEENWSATAWASPTCIGQPSNVSEVQAMVRVLTKNKVNFAIRSGGHMPSPGAGNINNGVLIDLSQFNQVVYDPGHSLATIGAGQQWGNVYSQLDHYNVTVVGGRVLDVGVAGLILGSGLSYLSDLYGVACDNVVNFQVIIADGSVINANSESNQDLFWALKGGRIVTAFTINTYPIHLVWGGIKEYSLEYLPALFDAMLKYQSNPNKDPYANIMMQAATTNSSIGGILNMVYLKPVENPAAFEPFYSLPVIYDTTKIQTLTEMMSGQIVPAIPRWDWHATSFLPDAELYQEIANITTTAPELKQIESLTSGTLTLGVQPISASVAQAGMARGGNALGLEAVNQNWFVLDVGWNDPSGDKIAHDATASIKAKIEAASIERGKYIEYIFMNDASYSQDVIGHYGWANVERLRAVQKKYDPDLVFDKLVNGGFKVPQ